jgi:hypothetical protein
LFKALYFGSDASDKLFRSFTHFGLNGSLGGNAEFGSSEPIFPLTRRVPKSGGQFAGVSKGEGHPSPDEEDFSFKVVRDPNAEIRDDDDRLLRTYNESLSSRGDNNRFLSRIQEEESDECDVYPPHEEDSPEGLPKCSGSILFPAYHFLS